MNCENCPDRPKAGTPYEETKCATCRLARGIHHDNQSNHGESHVNVDTLVQREGNSEYVVYKPESEEALHADLSHLLRKLARLDAVSLRIVCWRIGHPAEPLRIVAKECGISNSAASMRLRNACRAFPELKAAVNYKHRGRDGLGKFVRGNGLGFKVGKSGNPHGRPTRK